MENVYFSIIIPVYNVEKYLHQCVESVLSQTFSDFEIVLVDDGSPDRCPEICDEFARNDARVKVIHKENGGLSDARNYGIKAANGKYLLFLDSDDYWGDVQALEKTYKEILDYKENADIVIFQAQLLYPDGDIIPNSDYFVSNFNDMGKEEALRYMVENGLLIGSACSKVVKRSFLIEHSLFFKVGIKSEDIHWIVRVAKAMPKYQYTDQYFYMYRKGRVGSITTNIDYKHLCQLADILEEFSDEALYKNTVVKECILSLLAYQLTILMASAANLNDPKERKQLITHIKKFEYLLRYNLHPKVQQVNKVKKFTGFYGVMFLLGIYLRYRKR